MRITDKGQVTIPIAVREQLGLLPGTEVDFVVDGDALHALPQHFDVVQKRGAPTILTPHEGEFKVLTGAAPSVDRIADTRQLAADSGAIVLLKGSTSIVAAPDGRVLLSASGSSRLATAGTGDVLSGIIGAFLARGVAPLEAAALGAHVHGRAASLGFEQGLVAGDLPRLVAEWLSQ